MITNYFFTCEKCGIEFSGSKLFTPLAELEKKCLACKMEEQIKSLEERLKELEKNNILINKDSLISLITTALYEKKLAKEDGNLDLFWDGYLEAMQDIKNNSQEF